MTARAYWLEALAARTGQDPGLFGTKAVPRWCSRCRRLVLAGYDGDLCATLCVADPYRLTPQLEAACVVLARRTFELRGLPGRYRLVPRHVPGVEPFGVKASADQVLVLAAHACDRPSLTLTPLPEPAHRVASCGDVPPF